MNITLPMRIFKTLCIVLFVCFLIVFMLYVCTKRENIKHLTNSYVSAVEIDEQYFVRYYEEGFTKDMCQSLFRDNNFRDVVSNVMSDRLSVIFDYRDYYIYPIEYCYNSITTIITDYNNNYGLNLDAKTIESLVKYTCDVSGISSMFIYDTPASYRDAIFEADASSYDGYNSIFEVIAVLSSLKLVISLGVMYFICLIILFILSFDGKEALPQTIADTIIVPSLICVGISLGEICVITSTNEIQDYVFGHLLKISLLFLVIGIVLYVFCINIFSDKKKIPDIEEESYE